MELDNQSPTAWNLGFTDDKFYGTLDINRTSREILIIYIESKDKRKGNVRKFYEELRKNGWEVVVTRPCDAMNFLCRKLGYESSWEYHEIHSQWCWTWRGKPESIKNDGDTKVY